MKKITLMIPHALPGSGKSTYYNNLVKTSIMKNKEISLVDVDSWSRKKEENKEELKKYIKDNIKEESEVIIIDGLFLDNDIIAFLIRFVISLFEKEKVNFEIIVDNWNEDRQANLQSDYIRVGTFTRTNNSYVTIKNAYFEPIDKEYIDAFIMTDKYSLKIENHLCYLPSLQELVCKKMFIPYSTMPNGKRVIYSESWSEGGTYGNCWDDELHEIAPEPPVEFTDLLEILKELNLDPKKVNIYDLYDEIIEDYNITDIETYNESDYYGGSCDYSSYCIDVDNLFEFLYNRGLIDEDEILKTLSFMK